MLAGIRSRLTYANVVASIALFIALGGVAWAAATINSGDVINNSLKSVDLKDGKGVKDADVASDSLSGGSIDESSLALSEPWNEVGDDNGPDFSTTSESGGPCEGESGGIAATDDWVNYPGFQTAAFSRDSGGQVHLKGLVMRGASDAPECNIPGIAPGPLSGPDDIYSLPPGYRPAATSIFASQFLGTPAEVWVEGDGDVVAMNGDYFSVSLDGISFRCAPSGQNGCP